MDAMDEIAMLLDEMLADPRHGWSIGTFGAIGEFARDEGEAFASALDHGSRIIITARGGLCVEPRGDLRVIAYDTLSKDGETWGQSVAFCLPGPDKMTQGAVRNLGLDRQALRAEDRDARIFDTGTGLGHVQFCVRTHDTQLIAILEAIEGKSIFGPEAAQTGMMPQILRAQPNRVVISSIGRVEVYADIPEPGGKSPDGPHSHLLPKLLASGRTHAANAPIPHGFQPVLMLHPRSPWRDGMGQRVPFDTDLDDLFEDLLARFGLPEDMITRAAVEDAVDAGMKPDDFAWPTTRRGRTEARITLRRMARTEPAQLAAWRRRYDQTTDIEAEESMLLEP